MNNPILDPPAPWEPLADAFREELGECAHLLSLLEDQQGLMMQRRFVEAGAMDAEITSQLHRLQGLRQRSQDVFADLSGEADFASRKEAWERFLDDLPMGARELFRALRQEMQRQFARTQRFSQENLALLNTAREAYGELLRRVVPSQEKPAYDARGRSRQSFRGGVRSFAQIA
ncbi:MAG: hypothetical protein ACLFU2_10825 [Opitutales bacterium]